MILKASGACSTRLDWATLVRTDVTFDLTPARNKKKKKKKKRGGPAGFFHHQDPRIRQCCPRHEHRPWCVPHVRFCRPQLHERWMVLRRCYHERRLIVSDSKAGAGGGVSLGGGGG